MCIENIHKKVMELRVDIHVLEHYYELCAEQFKLTKQDKFYKQMSSLLEDGTEKQMEIERLEDMLRKSDVNIEENPIH